MAGRASGSAPLRLWEGAGFSDGGLLGDVPPGSLINASRTLVLFLFGSLTARLLSLAPEPPLRPGCWQISRIECGAQRVYVANTFRFPVVDPMHSLHGRR